MTDEALPQADCAVGAPHPRESRQLFGQSEAESQVLAALAGGRMHHAWLLTGPRGVGKATLAWRIARYLIATPPVAPDASLFADAPPSASSLDIPDDHPVARRVAALSDPGLLLIRRTFDADKKKFKSQIAVDDVRRLNGFFGLSSTDGGRRVVIVDSADEMNTSAANALLKVLEEPPKGAVLLLVSHHPARLLPTIRSRCREVRLSTLDADAVSAALTQAGADVTDPEVIAALSGGSAGEALRLLTNDGPELYSRIISLIGTCPSLDRPAALALAEKSAARGAEEKLDLTLRLLDLALVRLARHGAGMDVGLEAAPGERKILDRLSPDPISARKWADLQQTLGAKAAHARGVNVDPQTLMLDLFLNVNAAA